MAQTYSLIRTLDIQDAIEKYAKLNEFQREKVDFEILKYSTIVKLKSGALNSGEVSLKKPLIFREGIQVPLELWLNPDLEIFQEYDIEFKPHVFNPKFVLDFSFSANKTMTNVAGLIKKESRIAVAPNLSALLIKEINKRKAKHKIMIGLFDSIMIEDISRFSENITEHSLQDVKISICNCPDFEPSRDDSLILSFREKSVRESPSSQVSSVISVSSGEDLIEYIKAKRGKSARGINGAFYTISDPHIKYTPKFATTPAILIDDTPDKTVYTALNGGFVVFDDKTLDVTKELSISKIDFKSGSIDLGMEPDAKIEITKIKEDEDALAGGLSVRAYSVKLSGGIGDGAKVYAHDCEIGGQTHSTSCIEAENIKIRNHKGKAQARDAEIHVLENGFASAQTIKIDSMLGGVVKAHRATIGTAGANSSFYISESLHIDNPIGDGIKIYITTSTTREECARHSEIEMERDKAKHIAKEKQDRLKNDVHLIEANKDAILKLKARYSPDSPNASVIADQIRKFALIAKEVKTLSVEIEDVKKTIEKDNDILNKEESSILNILITVVNKWKNGAYIKLDLPSYKIETVLELPENSEVKKIWLIKQDDEYEFRTSK